MENGSIHSFKQDKQTQEPMVIKFTLTFLGYPESSNIDQLISLSHFPETFESLFCEGQISINIELSAAGLVINMHTQTVTANVMWIMVD